jgi:hypothetical protein
MDEVFVSRAPLAQCGFQAALKLLQFLDLPPDGRQLAFQQLPDVRTRRNAFVTHDEKFADLIE